MASRKRRCSFARATPVTAAAIVSLAGPGPARAPATTIFWDGTGTAWNSLSSWSTASNATTPNPLAVPGSADLAAFNISTTNANQTVNLNAGQAALGLSFNSTGSVTIQSGVGANTLTLGSSGITVAASAGTDTLSSAVALAGGQTWTNNSASTLTVSGNLSTGGSTLAIAGTGDVLLSGNVGGGSGSITVNGSNILTLTGSNSFTGNLSASGGTVSISSAANVGSANVVAIQNNGTLQATASLVLPTSLAIGLGGGAVDTAAGATLSVGLVSGGPVPLTKSGAGTLSITGSDFHTGGTSLNAGTLLVNSNAALGGANNSLTFNGGTLKTSATFSSARAIAINAGNATVDPIDGDLTLSGPLSGPGTLTVTAGGTLTLSNASNSYSGGTSVLNDATLAVSSNANLGNSAAQLLLNAGTLKSLATFSSNRQIAINPSGGTFDTNGFDLTLSGQLFAGGPINKTGAGTLALTNTSNAHSGTFVTGGTLLISSDANLGNASGFLSFANGATLRTLAPISSSRLVALNVPNGGAFDTNGFDSTLSGKLTGGAGLTKTGAATLTLSNTTSDYLGPTSVTGGALVISSLSNLGQSPSLALDGGALRNTITLPYAHPVSLGAGGGAFDVAAPTLTLSNVVSGTGALTKLGSGTLSLLATNTYAGGTSVSAGALAIKADANLGAAGTPVSLTDATLQFDAAVTSSRPISLAGTADTLMTPSLLTSALLTAPISGSAALLKTGAGVLTLANASNSYAGGTVVSAGTLIVSSDANLGAAAAPLTLANNATLQASNSLTTNRPLTLSAGGTLRAQTLLTLNAPITGTGPLAVTGLGRVTLNSTASDFLGAVNVTNGTLAIPSDLALGNPANPLAFSNGTFLPLADILSDRATTVGPGALIVNTNGFDIILDNFSTTSPAATIIKTNSGSLTINSSGYAAAGHTVTGGLLILGDGDYSGALTATNSSTLALLAATFSAGVNSLTADPDSAIEYRSSALTGGYLTGVGTHRVPATFFSTFTAANLVNGTSFVVDGAATFTNVSSGANLSVSSPAASLNWAGGTNSSAGSLILAGPLSTSFFSSDGSISITPSGSLTNSSTNLVLGGGSTTFIGSTASPGGTLSTAPGTSVELRGGLLVNDGTVNGPVNLHYGSTARGFGTYNGPVTVTDGGVFIADAPPTAPATLVVDSLTLADPTALADVNSSLVIDYTGPSPLSTIRSQIAAAYHNGLWDKPGISSTRAADPSDNFRTAVAVADNASLNLPSFANRPTDPTSILLKLTWYGDANLDGALNADDYTLLDRGFQQHLTGWTNGDFNYDNTIDSADYLLADRLFVLQSGPLSPSFLSQRESQFGADYVTQLLASVPEPASLFAACGFALVPTRRRR